MLKLFKSLIGRHEKKSKMVMPANLNNIETISASAWWQ